MTSKWYDAFMILMALWLVIDAKRLMPTELDESWSLYKKIYNKIYEDLSDDDYR